MKKYISIILVILLFLLCGCSANNSEEENEIVKNDYVVNSEDVINIGVILPLSGDSAYIGEDILESINYFNTQANTINIDKTSYTLELSVHDINDDISKTKEELVNKKAAAVICYGTDYDKTNSVITAFETESTPLVFIDNYSDAILSASTACSLAVPAKYQISVVSEFLRSEGLEKGVVICENNDYCKSFAENFKSLFESETSSAAVEIITSGIDSLDSKNIVKDSSFAFVIGSNYYSKEIAKRLISESDDYPVMLTETHNKLSLEDPAFNNCYFLSKLEQDSDDHNITRFISFYTNAKGISESDVTAGAAYGYDAYYLIYGALGRFNTSSSLDSIKNGSTSNAESVTITASQLFDAIVSNKMYAGPIDTFVFEEDGTIKPGFIFVDNIKGGSSSMLNKFTY